ncbi:Uncharacterised protein [Streptococcus anginosus]|uniref:DUF6261 family protein n=1 Tax=Streptococcus anginosus TaxID=1328 RepID=UPI0010CAB6B8|nr:DUF6261 family protein [Streptococcus anginosus]VTS33184.1 Uncharacterised protein [Streptococcus anginosus]
MKLTYGITTLDTKTLDKSEFSQLMTESKEAITAFNKAHKVESIYTSKLEEMSQHLAKFQEGLHRAKASSLVTSLDQADRERDDALGTLTALVRAFSRVKETATKEAYDTLAGLLKNYAGIAAANYEKETEGINHLLQETAQKRFEEAYKERLTELKGKVPSQSKQLRIQLQEIYDFLLDFTAIMTYAYPERSHYADLRDHLNTIRSRYKKRKAVKKVKEAI